LRDAPRGRLAARAFDVDFAALDRALTLRFAPRLFAAAVLRGVVARAFVFRAVRVALLARLAVDFAALTRFCPARERLRAGAGRRSAASELTTRGPGIGYSGASSGAPARSDGSWSAAGAGVAVSGWSIHGGIGLILPERPMPLLRCLVRSRAKSSGERRPAVV
jgi:hypothetical protein